MPGGEGTGNSDGGAEKEVNRSGWAQAGQTGSRGVRRAARAVATQPASSLGLGTRESWGAASSLPSGGDGWGRRAKWRVTNGLSLGGREFSPHVCQNGGSDFKPRRVTLTLEGKRLSVRLGRWKGGLSPGLGLVPWRRGE